ncbi:MULTISPECIES: MgtC/SapB family protein [Aquitalea]|uniref:Protein MgtC n=1 Tax=Aquitalea magnusonii TaxID=332411 RepID=A0A318JHU8_9NEIS|nr:MULTISPECIES: MgtC/SapB family protein [Aquitalea]PXX39832.1 putative Mg2+ transporter-C (MgtC) family protein [Aquitalea magnusonii]
MSLSFAQLLDQYWSAQKWEVNLLITCNLLGGLLLGCLVGYERWSNGRAAGMRTYGLVSMAATGVISMIGYSGFWYGGVHADIMHGDMTRVAQGVLTGVGFLGAGMIMKEGMSISGLTSAASVWMSSVIGILVGVGFYLSAIAVTLLCILCMRVLNWMEDRLPRRFSLFVTLVAKQGHHWTVQQLCTDLRALGVIVHEESIALKVGKDATEWNFLVSALNKHHLINVVDLSREIIQLEHIETFSVQPARN